MKNKTSKSLVFFLIVWVLASCNMPMGPRAYGPYYTPTLSNEDLKMTVAMVMTFAAAPSNTPPAWATIYPSAPGELGWGSVYGKVIDGITLQPIEGAAVRCEHFSYSTSYICDAVTTTNRDGQYAFGGIFFHDRDRLTLTVEMPGYGILRLTEQVPTRAELHTVLYLFPPVTATPTSTLGQPLIMCSPPPCEGGALVCGSPDGCPGGCGTICQMPTSIIMCTPPACQGGQLTCQQADGCPGGCGTTCQMPTP